MNAAPRPAITFGIFLLAALCLLSRDPGRLLQAQLWGEDGQWYYDAYMSGWRSLLLPHTGYLQTFPRLVALCAARLPATAVPTVFAAAGFLVQLAPIALLLSGRAARLIPAAARAALIAFYVAVPNSSETFINLTDAQWHLALMLFLLLVLPAATSRAGRLAEAAACLIGGLSGPFSILLTPLAWGLGLGTARPRRRHLTLIITATAALQAACILAEARTHRGPAPPGATFAGFAHIAVTQIFLAGIIGIARVARLVETPFGQSSAAVAAFCVLCLLAVGAACLRGPTLYRQFCAYAALILAVSLASPVASGTTPQWQALQIPGAGSRYYLLPILAWFAAILVLAADRIAWLRWAARLTLPLFLIGAAADWRYPRLPPTAYQQAARRFDAAPPGTTIIFPEDPDPAIWVFSLTKH